MSSEHDGLSAYMAEVGVHPVLSKREEIALFKKLEEGSPGAREKIIRSNLRFVIKVAQQFIGRGLPLEDLIQEGNIGLMEVVGKFDYKRGFRFSTYAAFWIRQAIQQALRKQCGLIRLPVRKGRMLGCLSGVVGQFRADNGRDPTTRELAEEFDTSEESINRLLKMREAVLSLDETHEDGASLRETIPEMSTPSPLDEAEEKERCERVREIMDFLGERERHVVRLRFGFHGGKSLSLRHTSRIVGLSQEGVRRIEQKALAKLRRPAISDKVAGLL
jgi:RNA polymerase primary sigma factor